MNGFCSLNFSVVLCFLSLLFLIISTTGSYWYGVKKLVQNKDEAKVQAKVYQSWYHVGLWMTCYYKNLPDTVLAKDLINSNCIRNYNHPSMEIEDFSRSSEVCLALSCSIIIFAFILGISGKILDKRNPLIFQSILLFSSGLLTFIGICCFIGRMILEKERRGLSQQQKREETFGWCFYMAWISLLLQIVSAVINIRTISFLNSTKT